LDNLIRILRSFSEGEEDSTFTESFIELLRDKVMSNLQEMYEHGLTLRNNRAVFPPSWGPIYSGLREIGFFERFIPVEYGGTKMTEESIYFTMELLGYTCPSMGIIFVAHSRAVDLILAGEDESQKQRYLSRLREGEFGAIAMTEEKAGTDASAIEFTARPMGDHYVFNGEKIFISNAGLADMYTQINAARGLCFYALKQIHTPYYRSASSQAKLFATQMVTGVAQLGLMIMGGRSYFKDNIIGMFSADARGMEYLEGTSSIQKMIISRELFKSYT
jgi:alkylation response protein AidB-like acyl-CoA dehydrogenase